MDKLTWMEGRWSCILQEYIPAHRIESREELQREKEILKKELDYLHPKRKDGEWDRRYSRNKRQRNDL